MTCYRPTVLSMTTPSRHLLLTLVALLGLGFTLLPTRAASLPGGNVGFNSAVALLLGNVPGFTAQVDTTLTNLTEKSRLSVPMRMLKREDRFRLEVDFIKMKGVGLAMQGLAGLQNIGMSRMTSLVIPQDKGMQVLFPELLFAVRMPLSEGDLSPEGFKISKKAAGKETVNGQACTRQNIVLTGPDGTMTEVTTWEAARLGNFPVRMLFRTSDSTMQMDFNDLVLSVPEANLFEVPQNYRRFDSIAGLMQEAMTQAIGGALGR